MPATLAISAHGTLVSVQLTPGSAWTDIAEQGDITPPALSRNKFDATTQNKNIDAKVLGVIRRAALAIPLNFLPGDASQDHLTGVQKLFKDNTVTGWKLTYADSAATQWIMSGQVSAFKPKAPVDGKLEADMEIEVSGLMTIGGVVIGA